MKVKHVLMIAAVLLAMLAVPVSADTVVTHSVTEGYTVYIPPFMTVGTPGEIGISGLIDTNTKVRISVQSANDWKLMLSDDALGYDLIDESAQSSINPDSVLVVTAGTTGSIEAVATLNDGESPKYRGDYTDVLTFTATQEAMADGFVLIRSYDELNSLITNAATDGTETKGLLISNIAVPADTTLSVLDNQKITLDLNSHTISSSNSRTETHNDFILVKGTLTVSNGSITYKHTGTNMEWNGCTNLFDVTDGGVLNMDGVTAQNLGGTDMNFAVHMNNWGEVTLNANNCVFDSTYCGVRVFNSGYDDNNVMITNSKLTGATRAFWVHNYIGDLNPTNHPDQEIKNRLMIDIFGTANNNQFEITGTAKSPIRYGFDNAVFIDPTDGTEITTTP